MKRQSKTQSRPSSKKQPKLRLKRETVRVLSDDQLSDAAGGGDHVQMTTWHCMAQR
jgi:hypothetical protein